MFYKSRITPVCLVSLLASHVLAAPSADSHHYSAADTIKRDVLIIGGGSSGTYSAIRLQDQGCSVAVIEAKDHLGGHAETYVAPNGFTIDIGVVVFENDTLVNNYFSRFDVPLVNSNSGTGQRAKTEYIDFGGDKIADYTPPAQSDVAAGYAKYGAQLQRFPDIDAGFFFEYPVASDLLLPFGDFVNKYDLSAIMRNFFTYNQGYVPAAGISTLYALKYLNLGELMSLSKGFLTTAHHNIQELYQKALAFLTSSNENNVFLSSNVISIDRSCSPAKIVIQTPKGRKLILAKAILNTTPPLPSLLKGFDLTKKEEALFSQFYANGYYTGILTNTSIPAGYTSENVAPGKLFDIPELPGLYSLRSNAGAPDHIQVYYGSPTTLDSETVKANIVADLHKLEALKGLPKSNPQWAIFSSHAPFNLMVPNKAIQNKFYEKLYSLQGESNTFWNGAAWHVQDSSYLWAFAENVVVPKILASLKKA